MSRAGETPVLTRAPAVAGSWCNDDPLLSAVLEAVSLATPVLEGFVIATVAAALAGSRGDQRHACALAFMREEAGHMSAHRTFNRTLLSYLRNRPPGLTLARRSMAMVTRRLSLADRLLAVACVEHIFAVLSRAYLAEQAAWHFTCASGQALFAYHAREEIGHRSVIFDLWIRGTAPAPLKRTMILLTLMLGGLAYLLAAVPWILRRKAMAQAPRSAAPRAHCLRSPVLRGALWRCLSDLFRFVKRSYEPAPPGFPGQASRAP